MEIKTKFEPGDSVYYIDEMDHIDRENCPTCKGKAILKIGKNRKISCPTCVGRNIDESLISMRWFANPIKMYIGRIIIGDAKTYDELFFPGQNIKYGLKSHAGAPEYVRHENNIFKTKENAERECEKRNKNQIRDKKE